MADAIVPPLRSYRRPKRPEERVRLLGETMDFVRPEEVLHFVDQRITERRGAVIASHNLQSVSLSRGNGELRKFFASADIIQVDSIALLLWARLTRRNGYRMHRSTYLDWRDAFWGMAVARKWRVLYLGEGLGVAQSAVRSLTRKYPGLKVAARDGLYGVRPGSAPFGRMIEAVHAFRPHVVLVGMDTPRQEAWILRHRAALPECVIFTVGAAFDFEAGVQAAAPRWVARIGVEWLYRVIVNPRRFVTRYCVEPVVHLFPR
jgi:N-acetylglucosaminyldiphosphoundecaprenol N-acetyl-beta-D-mannosaminyltransferase